MTFGHGQLLFLAILHASCLLQTCKFVNGSMVHIVPACAPNAEDTKCVKTPPNKSIVNYAVAIKTNARQFVHKYSP